MLMLLAPAIQGILKPFKIPVLNENRRRTEQPKMTMDGVLSAKATYGKDFEAYFNDHYGFRDLLIRTKNQIDFSLFHQSNELIIGKDGYFFYRTEIETEEFPLDLEWEQGKDKLWSNFKALHEYFAARGMMLVTIPIPLKNTVYPELLPSWAVKRPKITAFHKFRKMLAEGDLPYVDAYQALMDNIDEAPFFHRTDFHWNDVGAAYVGRAIVNELGQRTRLGVSWTEPIAKKEYENFSGGQNLSLAIFNPPTETTWIDQAALLGQSSYTEGESLFRFSFKSLNQRSPLLPNTVILADSFGECFRTTDLPYYFSEFHDMHYKGLRKNIEMIPADTKIVIFAFIETTLLDMLRDPDRAKFWPKILPIQHPTEG